MEIIKKCKQNMMVELFVRLILAQLLLTAITSLCSFFDSYLISITLGKNALAAMDLLRGFTGLVMIVGILLTDGVVFLLGKSICRGNHEESDRIFSVAVTTSVVVGVCIAALCCLFAAPICRLLGADDSILPLCCDLMRGYAIGYYLLLPVSLVYLTLFEMRSDGTASAIILSITLVVHIGLVCLFLFPLKKELVFVGIAASLSQVVCIALLLFRNITKKFGHYVYPKKAFPLVGSLFAMGFSASGGLVVSCFKDIIFGRIRADFGGVRALSASGVVVGVDALTGAFVGAAFLSVVLMICGVYVNEEDRDSVKRFIKIAFIVDAAVTALVMGVMFFTAEPVARLYHVEEVPYTVKALCIYSFAYLTYLPNMLLIKVYAVLRKTKLVNLMIVLSGLVVPVATAVLLALSFGEAAVWPLMPLSEAMSLLCTLLIISVVNGRVPRSLEELLCLDEDFGVAEENTYSFQAKTKDDAVKASEEIVQFCREKGLSNRTASLCGLCMEEVIINIITHGFRHKKKEGIVDVTVVYDNKTVKLLVRDNCPPFDPYQKLATFDTNNPVRGVGIRLMMKTADLIEYKNMYGMNLLTAILHERGAVE